jgi:hypothetical protein
MSYQDRIDIDRLYDLVYDTQSEQLKVITREEFEQIVGSTRDLKDKMALYPDKSEVELEIFKILRDAGVITDDKYNELVGKIQIAQNTANIADDKATNAVGTANNAQKSARNALDGVDRIDGEIGDASTQGTIKYNVNQAKTQSSQAIQDSSVAKKDSSQALSNSKDALEGVDRIDGEIGDATTPNTIKYDVFNAKSDSTEALGKSNQAISDSSDALDLAETVDGKANQLRTDVGTVNQPNDGSLQQQITYLPSYIRRLFVSDTISTDDDHITNFAHIDLNDTVDICGVISELGAKTIRDTGSITLNFYISDPDNVITKRSATITDPRTYARSFSYWFSKNGLYVIACEHLKYAVWVGDFALAGHTHTKSEITDFSHTHTRLQITDFSHAHWISEIHDLQPILDNKQNKATYSLIGDITSSSQTNGSVKVYTDGLDVLIEISGTFTNINANGNTTIGNLNIVDYYPSMDYAISNNASIQADRQAKCWIRKSDGAVALSNGTSSTSIIIYAIIRYPLASRMP